MTAQIPERILIDGKPHWLHARPLDHLLAERGTEITAPDAWTTAARDRPPARGLQAGRGKSVGLRSPRHRRNEHGGHFADARSGEGCSIDCRAASRRRCGSAALGRTGTGPRGHHRFRQGPRGPADRGLSSGRGEPHHRQCTQDQSWRIARVAEARRALRLLVRRSEDPGGRGGQGRRARQPSHSTPLPSRSDRGHPGALSDAARPSGGAFAQCRSTKGPESESRGSHREIRLDLRARRQGDADRERLRA